MGDLENFKTQLLNGNFDGVRDALSPEFTNIIIDHESQAVPIHIACQHGHLDIAELLIKHQCDIESKTNLNWRPIHVSCWYGHVDMVKWLIEHQCNIESETKSKMRPIHVACENGHFDIVALLVDHQCSIECQTELNERPIHFACWHGHLAIAQLLVKHRCDIECETEKGIRPIHYSTMKGNLDIVKLLVAENCDIYCQTGEGCSPLDLASQFGHVGCEEFIVGTMDHRNKTFSTTRDNDEAAFGQLYNSSSLTILEHNTGLSVLEIAAESNADRVIEYVLNQKTDSLEVSILVNVFRNREHDSDRLRLVQECVLYRAIRDHHQAAFQWSCSARLVNRHGRLVSQQEWSSYLAMAAQHGSYAFVNDILRKTVYDKEVWEKARQIALRNGHQQIADMIGDRESLIELRLEAHFSLLHTAICDGDVDMMGYILDTVLVDMESNKETFRSALVLAQSLCQVTCLDILQRIALDFDTSETPQESQFLLIQEANLTEDIKQDEQPKDRTQPKEESPTCWPCFCKCCRRSAMPGGLKSTSKACHLNAMIQAVASSDIVIGQLTNINIVHHSPSLTCFLDLLHGINESKNVSYNTKLLEDLVQRVQWTISLEQDVFELFSTLIKGIQDELRSNQAEQTLMPMKIKLVHRFQGINIPDTVQDHFGLSLGLCGDYSNKPGVTLQFLINEHFKPKIIDDDPSKSTQRFFYKEAPEVLFLHILSNRWDSVRREMYKPKYHIVYKDMITLSLDIITELNRQKIQQSSFDYKIRALVRHKGEVTAAHKATYRSWRGNWYMVNDQQVKRVKFKTNICPYILIYERQPSMKTECRKPSGLYNTSTTCYMNSIIQLAASSDVLIEQFERLQLLNSQSRSLNCFLDLLHGINETEDVSANTKLVEALLQEFHLDAQSQQDAFEMFASLIKVIHDEFKSTQTNQIQMPLTVTLVHRFKDKNISDKIQDHFGLSLGLCGNYQNTPGVTLDFLIVEHFMPTFIDDDPSKLTQLFFYKEIPDVLLLHIQAYKWDNIKGEMVKPEYHIIYNEEMVLGLDIVTDISAEKVRNDKVNYRIRGVVQHRGDGSSGHYVAYRNWGGNWYFVNDEQVEQVEFSNSICPYILIYERRQST